MNLQISVSRSIEKAMGSIYRKKNSMGKRAMTLYIKLEVHSDLTHNIIIHHKLYLKSASYDIRLEIGIFQS